MSTNTGASADFNCKFSNMTKKNSVSIVCSLFFNNVSHDRGRVALQRKMLFRNGYFSLFFFVTAALDDKSRPLGFVSMAIHSMRAQCAKSQLSNAQKTREREREWLFNQIFIPHSHGSFFFPTLACIIHYGGNLHEGHREKSRG